MNHYSPNTSTWDRRLLAAALDNHKAPAVVQAEQLGRVDKSDRRWERVQERTAMVRGGEG
jgi:hypothetical protein